MNEEKMGLSSPALLAFYPDDDFAWFRTEAGNQKVHKDGKPYV